MKNTFRGLIGVVLVVAGALLLIVAYLAGWSSSNWILLAGIVISVIGVILYVREVKNNEDY